MTAELTSISHRLLLITITSPNHTGEAENLGIELKSTIADAASHSCILVTDCSGEDSVLPHIRASYLRILQSNDERISRSAFLVAKKSIFGDQIKHMIEQAHGSQRRVFEDKESLIIWLNELLSPQERIGLQKALSLVHGALHKPKANIPL